MGVIERAREFAIKAHAGQMYGKLPYEYHLQQVVNKLLLWRDYCSYQVTDEYVAAGWLHDVMEDCSVTWSELNKEFGPNISTCVLSLTKSKVGYDEYLENIRLRHMPKTVKMADTMCNLEASLLSGELKRVNKYAKQLAILTEN